VLRIYAIKECQSYPKRCIEQVTKSYRIMILPSIYYEKGYGQRAKQDYYNQATA
jgi:hypothetical protein